MSADKRREIAERRVYEYLRLYVDFGNLTEINSLGAAGFQVVGILPANAPYDAVVLLMRDITGLARAAEEGEGWI